MNPKKMGCMMKKLKFGGVLALFFIIISCARGEVLVEYTTRDIDSRPAFHELPSYVVEKKKPKVAILPAGAATELGRKCNVGQMAQEHLTQILTQIGGVDLVERGQLEYFMQELKFQVGITQEIDVNKFMKIAKDVDFAFVGSVPSTSVTARFTDARTWTDKKGKTHYSPPSCTEEGKVWLLIDL